MFFSNVFVTKRLEDTIVKGLKTPQFPNRVEFILGVEILVKVC
jgi:hypothetical protein